jgi:drug/metabolite transporter (DMT)-like permease
MHGTSKAAHHHTVLLSIAVAFCGGMWGVFWYPMRWLEEAGVGGGWVSLVFNAVALLSPLPWMLRRSAWDGLSGQLLTGLLLGSAFTLYTVSLVMTDVIHAILLFYLTPVWSTLGGWLFLGNRLTVTRAAAMILGLAGMVCILGGETWLPLPRNEGDVVALVSGMLWAAGTLRSYAAPHPGVAQPVFAFSLGGLLSSAAVLLIAEGLGSPLSQTGALVQAMPLMVAIALVMYVPPNFMILWAAQRIDPGRVGILLMTEVLVGAISAALFSGEPFGIMVFAGTALIVSAGLVEVLGRR